MRMKKLLTFLTLLTLFFTAGWAEEVTYTFTSKSWEATPANWIGTADGSQFNTSGTPKGVQVTTGAGSGATITCPVSYDNISKVEVTYSSSSKAVATISVSIGTFQIGQYSVSKSQVETTLTYTPNVIRSGVVSFTPNVTKKSIGINSVKIYYTPSGSTTETCATPTFSPVAGTYYEPQSVTLSCATPGSTIYYTTDGSDPTTSSTEYTSAIPVSETTTIKAIATADGMDPSPVASATYTIDEPTEVELNYENTLISSHTDFYIIDRSLGGLSQVWKNSSYGITANGQNRTDEVESWLYSPVFDATSKSGYTISLDFEENLRYFARTETPTTQATLWVREGTTGAWQQLAITPHANVDNNNFHSIETIDLSAYAGKKFQLAFKYVADMQNAPGRWELKNLSVTATKEASTDLYILGMVNGNGVQPNQGVKMTYDGNNYNAKIWVIGNSDNAMGVPGTWFAFTTVLAENDDNGGWGYVNQNRYSPTPSEGDYYWLTNGTESNITLTKQNNDKAFLIPAGLYEITVSGDLSKFSLTSIKNLKPTITPEGGEVLLNSTATIALAEDFNDFIADCNPVVTYAGSPVSITAPVAKLFVNDNAVEGTSSTYTFSTVGSTTITGKGALVVNGNDQYAAKTNSQNFTVVEPSEGSVYTLVESATDLVAGSEYIIVGSTDEKPYSAILGPKAGSNNNTYATAVKDNFTYVAADKTITLQDGCTATPIILGGNATDGWTFLVGDNTYLAYNSTSTSSNNYLHFVDDTKNGRQWYIDTEELPSDKLLIHNKYNDKRYMMYNEGNTRFASYLSNSNMTAVALFKKGGSTTPKSDAPVITPESKDVKGGLLEDVTITAAQGATIYYTTDGSDPSDDTNTNRVQYTEPFNIQVAQGGPQTVKAIAIETGKDASNVVSVQYMFKNPDAPTFTPDPAVVQTGDFTITINSADGGVIYYVLDPDANEFPSNSEEAIATGQVYADGVAVSGTGEHKIYAAVVLNGLKSTLSTATYTVIETGAEGDWKLVESLDDIQAGRDYIIVNSDRDRAIKSGDLETSRFYSTPCEGHVVFGPNFASATVAGTDVRVFSFEAENGKMYMKDSGTSQYYNLSSDVSTGKTPVVISMSDGFVYINGEGGTKKLAYNTAYGNYFGMYTNPTTTGSQRPIYMYYRGATVTPSVTLAELCQNGVTTDGSNKYVIKDRLVAVYADLTKGVLWCKDEGNASIFPTNIKEGQIDYLYNDTKAQNKRDWDQSNWIALHFTTPTSTNGIDEMLRNAQNHYIKAGTIKGTYFDKVNYALRMDNEALDLVTPADEGGNVQPDYIPNVYCTTNFLPDNLNIWGDERDGGYTTGSDQNYFFMNPKIQEICEITYAQWDAFNLCFTVPSNSGFDGAFYVGWGYNVLGDLRNSLQDEHIYKFQAIVQRSDKDSYGPKNITTPYAGFTVYPVDLDVTEGSGHDITTAINTVSVNGDVKSVKYVNVAGVVSDKPFSGVNIVVTEYTDGSRSTTKMLRK